MSEVFVHDVIKSNLIRTALQVLKVLEVCLHLVEVNRTNAVQLKLLTSHEFPSDSVNLILIYLAGGWCTLPGDDASAL
jgi:hypothetical protein